MNPKLRIALLSHNATLHKHIGLHLQSKGYQVVALPEPSMVLGFIYTDPPDLIIIDLSATDQQFYDILRDLKQDNYFSVIPVIGLISEPAIESFDWPKYRLDDFVSLPIKYPELFSRIRLSHQRIQRIFDNNPLTKLPGNASIQRAIAEALGQPMAVCYIDINDFKPYNDTFGFARGDEVLRMVARIMSNTVREAKEGSFVGHIGGDDFVFIVPTQYAEPACQTIIANFNIIVSDLFDDEAKARGFYLAQDRKGEAVKVPLLGISIAIVPTDNPQILHAGKVAAIAAELKKFAKKQLKSCYVIHRRKGNASGWRAGE
jgi:PleD family two-component response regulator